MVLKVVFSLIKMMDLYPNSLCIKSEKVEDAECLTNTQFVIKKEIEIEKEIEIGPTELQKPDLFFKFQSTQFKQAHVDNKNNIFQTPDCIVFLERSARAETAVLKLLSNRKRQNTYECDACLKRFQSKQSLITHLYVDHTKSVTSSGSAKCYKCGKILADRDGLGRHLVRMHFNDTTYKCPSCPRIFKQPSYRRVHHRRVHEKLKPYKCRFCDKNFFRKGHMQLHEHIHTGERPFKCNVCDKTFNRNHVLVSHMFIHTGDKPYKCQYCEFSCRDQPTLRKHTRRHNNTHKTFACAACSKRFDAGNKLRAHIALTHALVDMRMYECHYCNKKFGYKTNLAKHINTIHTRAVEWVCGMCDRRFACPSNLDTHVARHSRKRPHKCAECGSKFKTQGDLRKHSYIHEPAQFVCGVCGRGFHRSGHLANHLRVMHNHTLRRVKKNEL